MQVGQFARQELVIVVLDISGVEENVTYLLYQRVFYIYILYTAYSRGNVDSVLPIFFIRQPVNELESFLGVFRGGCN